MGLEPEESATLAPAPSGDTLHHVTILVCSTCRNEAGEETAPTPGQQLFAATRAAYERATDEEAAHIRVASVECLGNCKRRLSASIVTSDCWTYVFGDLQLDNAADLLTGARLMLDTPNGLMPWRGRPQCLKSGMVARVPPLGS